MKYYTVTRETRDETYVYPFRGCEAAYEFFLYTYTIPDTLSSTFKIET